MKRQILFYFIISLFLISFSCKEVGHADMVPYESDDGNWGYKDYESQKIVIPAKYNLAYPFINNYSIVGFCDDSESNWLFGIIDTMDNFVLKPEYNRIHIDDGYIKAYKNSLIHLFDSNMNEIIPPLYSKIQISKGQYMLVENNGKWACYDTKKKRVSTSFEYDRVYTSDNFRRFKSEEVVSIIVGSTDTSSICIEYETGILRAPQGINWYLDSICTVTDVQTRRTIVTDKKGKIRFDGYYGHLGSPSYDEGLMVYCDARLMHNPGKWGAIDMEDKTVIPFMYDCIIKSSIVV